MKTFAFYVSLLCSLFCLCCTNAYACHPTLKCVMDNEDGNYTAVYGYAGTSSYLPIGSQNQFSPLPKDRGQGTSFTKSSVAEHVRAVFPKTGSVSWTLFSTTVKATSATARCTDHKVLVCHIPAATPKLATTISIDETALPFHLGHGDVAGACKFDCAGLPFGHAVIDLCGVCGGDNSTCKDCAGVPNGSAKLDECGVCKGDGSSCAGCDGVPNSEKVLDLCQVCGGDNSSCKDCAGVPNGTSVIDLCGVCAGDNSTCKDCAGVPNGSARLDLCGVCAGDSSTCKDCAGVPNGEAKLDQCGICAGDNSTCSDCKGDPNGAARLDECGVCGGDSSTCKDCAGVPNGGLALDKCGVCGGSDSCLDCAGIPNGGTPIDCCGVCGGDGTSCPNMCKTFDNRSVKKTILRDSKTISAGVVKYSKIELTCGINKKERKATLTRIAVTKLLLKQQLLLITTVIEDSGKSCDTPYCHKVSFVDALKKIKGNLTRLITLHHTAVHASLKACCKSRGICGGDTKSVSKTAFNRSSREIKKLPAELCKK